MKHTLTCLLLLLPFTLLAQLHVVAEGPSFEEPEDGFGRILALKDGSTAYLHIEPKDDIEIRIYNPEHKEIAAKTIEPNYGKLRAFEIEGIYEINNDITLFISEWEDKIPTLYRLTLNERTGDIKELKTIATLMKGTMGQGYAVAYGDVPTPGFIVRKDPFSDAYGAIRYNTFENDRSQRVELIQYNGDGTELSKNFLSSPNNKYKYTQIIDFVITGQNAYALLYSYNTDKSGGAANELLLATVSGGEVSYQNVGQSYKGRIDEGILKYNPITKNFIFLTSESGHNIQFAIIDLKTASIKQPINITRSSVNVKFRRIFKNREERYSPLPQNIYINDDGTFTILLEEVVQIIRTTYTNGTPTSSRPSGISLGTAAIVTFTEEGIEKSSQIIPKSQSTLVSMFNNAYRNVESYYIAKRENTAIALHGGNQYKSLVYLNGKKKDYVLLNDIEENGESIQKGKLTDIRGVGDCDAWSYDLSDSTALIPPRTMVFPQIKKRDHNLAIFTLSDYDREHDVYATLKLEKGKVKLAWVSGE